MREPMNSPGFAVTWAALGLFMLGVICGLLYMIGSLLLYNGPNPWLP